MGCKCNKHSEKHSEESKKEIHCSCFTCDGSDQEREETQLKSCWEVNTFDVDRVIFTAPGLCKLIASGTITYECSTDNPSSNIIVRFWRGDPAVGGVVVQTLRVDEGSSVAFVAQNFNAITVMAPTATATVPARGELCITPNFKLPSC